MERRTDDPQELDDLFRIDHLTTCLRRHAESLTILSGQSPARGWQNPVPFMDVIRASVADVAGYTRISVSSAGDTGLAGPAVGDVIHMIAELIENATIYSPPNTPVVIQGGIVGHGFAIEIEDRGLGMSDEKLAEANGQLAEPLPFDPANTDQLGLLVAGQLARRHDIQITLRRNPYGGTTAIVLIPHSIVVAEGLGELEPVKALESAPDSAPPLPGRHDTGEQNGFAASEDTEPDLAHEGVSGERGAPGDTGGQAAGLPSYHAAPPAPTAPVAPPTPPPPAPAPPVPAPPAPAPPAPAPPAAAAPPRAGNQGQPVLPRRVRQASLVPQLRNPPPAYPPLPGRYGDPRPPDEARATVSAIQHGWERGRSMFAPPPGPEAPEAGESGTAHDEGGTFGTYQQETPAEDRGPD